MLQSCIIKDNLIFSFSNKNDYIYSVSDIDSGELVCQLFKKGRASNEPLETLPIWDIYEEKEDSKALLFSYLDSRLFICNISSSLSSGSYKYDRIVKLNSGKEGILMILTFYQTSDSTMIAYNTNQVASEDCMTIPPVFEIYNTYTGELIEEYDLFNMIDIRSNDREYTSKNYLYNYNDIKPDRTKLAFCMSYMPQINILDIATGEAKGFRIKDHKDFTAGKPVNHFSSLQCDDEYRLDNYFTDLHLDGKMLYFSCGVSDKLSGLPVASLIQ